MNTAELKHKIIQSIDHLNEKDFEKVYPLLVEALQSTTSYQLSEEENKAIDSALEASEKGETYSHNEVVSEAKKKYPNLKFK
ncbi:MAG TPA: hypothetical protein VKA27_11905 [Sunxiuqinia sp.]|nr:hypothetical protein [Sunxiuqinia sp.]